MPRKSKPKRPASSASTRRRTSKRSRGASGSGSGSGSATGTMSSAAAAKRARVGASPPKPPRGGGGRTGTGAGAAGVGRFPPASGSPSSAAGSSVGNRSRSASSASRGSSGRGGVFRCVVKVYASMCAPNYSMPWQMRRQTESTASGFVVSKRRILTNAHAVMHYSAVQVRKHGFPDKVNARVVAIGHDSDTALLAVDDEDFWEGLDYLDLGGLPQLQTRVTVVGYPTGGDNISVTAGVVSRVDLHRYSLSYVSLLAIQIDAAINSGNSGGPAFDSDGNVVGIAFETLADAENIGYIIPVPVVAHFLEDVERATKPRIGFGRLGFQWQALENKHLREYLNLTSAHSGVVVTKVLPLSSLAGKLKKHDVVTEIDGHNIANDGTVAFRNSERIAFRYHVTRKHLREVSTLKVLRKGKAQTIRATIIDIPPLVPQTLYNKRPSYFVHAGMVFTVLTEPALAADYGRNWGMKAPVRMVNMTLNGTRKHSDQQVVILSMMLAHPVNVGYRPHSFKNLQVMRVNGTRVRNIAHLAFLVERATGPSLTVSLSSNKVVVFDRAAAAAATDDVLRMHNIARDRSDDIAEELASQAEAAGKRKAAARPKRGSVRRSRRAAEESKTMDVAEFVLANDGQPVPDGGDTDDDCDGEDEDADDAHVDIDGVPSSDSEHEESATAAAAAPATPDAPAAPAAPAAAAGH